MEAKTGVRMPTPTLPLPWAKTSLETPVPRGASAPSSPVDVADFMTRRVALHRHEYASERGLGSEDELERERAKVRALEV